MVTMKVTLVPNGFQANRCCSGPPEINTNFGPASLFPNIRTGNDGSRRVLNRSRLLLLLARRDLRGQREQNEQSSGVQAMWVREVQDGSVTSSN